MTRRPVHEPRRPRRPGLGWLKRLLLRVDKLIHRIIPVQCDRSHLHSPVSYTSFGNTTNSQGTVVFTYTATK